ncbi:TlpA family protein disulfide reductase [Maribacter sp. 2304DJ31-5]|uniref:TlpA family protein disulfide reductase n=1 Tax=Maribacter sp. 2304DJ31-5 TaxID=3386273 RepID=UPI0039BCFF13
MKKILLLSTFIIAFGSCKVTKDHATLSGTITNQNSGSLVISSQGYTKKIAVNEDGTFNDTLKIKEGKYRFVDGKKMSSIYLKNGYDLKLTLDAKEFHKTVTFSGEGANINNYIAKKVVLQNRIYGDPILFTLERDAFDAELKESLAKVSNLLASVKDIDTAYVTEQKSVINDYEKYFVKTYEDKQYMATVLARGKVSPKFTDYENYTSGTMSLDDLKGKYVYIDMWATWCVPCIREFPFLKELEKAYHDKNIEFVSISIDKQNAAGAWRKMIVDKELTGIQLLAKDETFVDAYRISGIPRFILIDPEGNIISADAPRPSLKEELKILFDSLEINQ